MTTFGEERNGSALTNSRGSWREFWGSRELIVFFASRDLKVRYRQAVFGVLWVVVQPLAMVAVFTLVFDTVAQVPTGGIPYPLFAMTGLVIWMYYTSTVTAASDSLVSNSALVTKVYFPRLTAPAAAALPPFVDLGVSLVVVGGMCWYFDVTPTWRLVGLPLCLVLVGIAGLGIGIWLSAVNVRYRDVRHAVTPLLQVLLFLSPVAYAPALAPIAALGYALNPLVGVIGLFRWSVLSAPWPGWSLLVSVVSSAVVLSLGLSYFRRAERAFADVI